jgi:hypothetical protein
VAALTEGVLKGMLLSKLKAAVTVLFLAFGLIVFGGGLHRHQAEAQPGPADNSHAVDEKYGEAPQQERETQGFTAWGQELGGLQAGLGYRPGQMRAYSRGETVRLVVRVRNVGREAVKFQYLRQFLIENPPSVTDGDGKPVPLGRLTAYGLHIPVEVNLAPGSEIELYELKLEPRSATQSVNERERTLYGTGKFSIQYERILGNSSLGFVRIEPPFSKLATGTLQLAINPDPLPASKKK